MEGDAPIVFLYSFQEPNPHERIKILVIPDK